MNLQMNHNLSSGCEGERQARGCARHQHTDHGPESQAGEGNEQSSQV